MGSVLLLGEFRSVVYENRESDALLFWRLIRGNEEKGGFYEKYPDGYPGIAGNACLWF